MTLVTRHCACRLDDNDTTVELCKLHGDIIHAALEVSKATFSHIDGRDLLAELHPRRQLDIKRRIDGIETWFEGDWLSTLWAARKKLDESLVQIGAKAAPADTAAQSFPLRLDTSIPNGEIHIKHPDGRVDKIVNIGEAAQEKETKL